MSGEPGPVELEASSMPANNGLGPNEDQRFVPSRPKAQQQYPEESVSIRKTRPRSASRQDCELLPQSQVLYEKMMA